MLHSSLLRQLDEIARSGSIRSAAETLNVSASSINRRLLQLEEELGLQLFHRHRRGMTLTAAGEIVIAHIRETLRDHERLHLRLRELRGTEGTQVRISAMHGLAAGILPRLIREFRAAHPEIHVTVRAQTTAGVDADLAMGAADLGLSYAYPQGHGIEATAVFPTRLGVIVAAAHPLAARSDLRLMELADHPLAIADETMTINHLVSDAFARAGLRIRPTYKSNSIELLKSMVRAGEAISFLSRIDVDEDLRTGQLAYIPILGRELKSHELRLGRRIDSTLAPAVTLFEESLRQHISRIETPWVD
ncbi:LysR family transcriptional regulator [Celeribacter indicus]|uniref:LysR family transcripitonal regulator n=1 Tax=Celeribacter indicus TaxID=1208324 RepID=A0A0B5DV08_9RHOB|nr:LysR family transcriptional regulator [Celeribacter indicus]AJE46859.1 LysR family transcripitonal regulator [Celeribacter indicus]SDW80114.1 DNA-binding transcriptional regulator, LysR family [Celeribacter indicus]